MPSRLEGSFRAGYSVDQESSVSQTFLSAWATDGNELLANEGKFVSSSLLGPQPAVTGTGGHYSFLPSDTAFGCTGCHVQPNATTTAPDFTAFVIGANGISGVQVGTGSLNDDHPIGVRYPSEFGAGVDYNPPTVEQGRIAFFDRDGDRHADANEIRLYNTGDGYEVECASCHDPHGVPQNYDQNGAPVDGSQMIPSFLRVGSVGRATADDAVAGAASNILGNTGSELCLTCHVK